MSETTDIISALLYVAQYTSPFTTSHALYGAVKFVKGYPLFSLETPTVALYEFGGPMGRPKGLGRVTCWRSPVIRVDILTETKMDATRIIERLRLAWQADYECVHYGEAGYDPGDVGNGYLRASGVKGIEFGEPQDAPWDDQGRVARKIFDLSVKFGD